MARHTASHALVPTCLPATTHLTECTRDLILLAARLSAVPPDGGICLEPRARERTDT